MIQKLEHCVKGTDYGCSGATFSEVIDKVNEVIDYINSLPEEKPSRDLEEAVENYIAPIENDEGLDYINFNGRDIKDAFIAGWNGSKEQMLKDAVEGEVENSCFGIVYLRKNLMNEGYSTGDKVKIIILKDGE